MDLCKPGKANDTTGPQGPQLMQLTFSAVSSSATLAVESTRTLDPNT